MSFDGHHLELEDEFAFSLCETREEWERQQEEDRPLIEGIARKERERHAAEAAPQADSVWQASFVNWDALASPNVDPRQGLLALGFHLADLVGDLRNRPDGADWSISLNEAYGELRASQDAVARDSAAQEFRDTLEGVCENFSDLTARCADLQSRLDEVLRRL